MLRSAQACSDLLINSDPPSTWIDLILNDVFSMRSMRNRFAVDLVVFEKTLAWTSLAFLSHDWN